MQKLLLMGPGGSGKTSMRSVVFANYLPRDAIRLGITIELDRTQVKVLNNLILNLWDCFPVADTRILTDHGFLFYDEATALEDAGVQVKFACYDATTETLVYCRGELLHKAYSGRIIDFTDKEEREQQTWTAAGNSEYRKDARDCDGNRHAESNHFSLRTTPRHRMFVQQGTITTASATSYRWEAKCPAGHVGSWPQGRPTPPQRVLAEDLVSDDDPGVVRFVGCAAKGYTGEPHIVATMLEQKLGLTEAQLEPFLRVYGFWLGVGSLAFPVEHGGSESVTFQQRKTADITFLRTNLPLSGLLAEEWHSYDKTSNTVEFVIRNAKWFDFFDELHGERHRANTDDDEFIKSAKTMPPWVLEHASVEQLRAIVEGMNLANGKTGEQQHHQIWTSSHKFREQLCVVLLHAGYSPRFALEYPAGTIRGYKETGNNTGLPISVKEYEALGARQKLRFRSIEANFDSWAVDYSPPTSISGSNGCRPVLHRKTEISSTDNFNGDVWCVAVDHPDHLIVAQRAHRNVQGAVTKAARPVVAGNCGGQHDYVNDYLNRQREYIFRNVGVLLFVFDVAAMSRDSGSPLELSPNSAQGTLSAAGSPQWTRSQMLEYFQKCMKYIKEYSPSAKVFCLLHKIDLISPEFRETIYNTRKREILDSLQSLGDGGTANEIMFFQTSIWYDSLYQAYSSVIRSLVPHSDILFNEMKQLLNTCHAYEVALYERSTFLCLTHCSSTANTSTSTTSSSENGGTTATSDRRTTQVSEVIKGFKLSCLNSSTTFVGFNMTCADYTALIYPFTECTVVLVVSPITGVTVELQALQVEARRRHFLQFLSSKDPVAISMKEVL